MGYSRIPVWFHAAEEVGLSEELDTSYHHPHQQLLTSLENNMAITAAALGECRQVGGREGKVSSEGHT